MMVVSSLSETTRRQRPRSLTVAQSSLRPTSSLMTWPPVRMAMSSSMALRRSPKPGALMARTVQGAAQLVDHQGGQRLAVDILGDDDQVLGDLEELLQHGQDVGDGGDLLVGDQDVGILDLGLHAVGVGDEVGGDVAAVELHAFDVLDLERLEALGLFDGDDAVLADFVHDVGDQVADLGVGGGDGGDVGDVVLVDDQLGIGLDGVDQQARWPSRCRA